MKCDVCGVESDFEAAFTKERRSFRRSLQTLCPLCRTHQREFVQRIDNWLLLAVIAGGVIAYVVLRNDPASDWGRVLTNIFFLQLFYIAAVIGHELAHALMARALGWRIFAIVIGIRKQLFKFHLFQTTIVFNSLPTCGITRFAPLDARWFRPKLFLVIAAAPALNASLALWAYYSSHGIWSEPNPLGGPTKKAIFFVANVAVTILTLVPYHGKTFNVPSDGKQLLDLLFRKPKDSKLFLAMRYVIESSLRRDEFKDLKGAQDWCNRGLALFPGNFHLLCTQGLLCLDQKNYEGARQIYLPLLARETRPGPKRDLILNNLAYADALTGDAKFLPEADACSKEAYERAPWLPHIAGTRGTVLVDLGQFAAGIKLLEKSLLKEKSPASKAAHACHLAIAYARFGDRKQADNYLKLARQLDPHCALLEHAEREPAS
jgi:tetratricopeptide (TPR) repeat protein